MKKSSYLLKLYTAIIILAAVFAVAACEQPTDNSHSHVWELVETKAPTTAEAGEAVLKCRICGQTGEKSTIPALDDGKIHIEFAEISINAPVKDMAPAVTASGAGAFTVGPVSWSPDHNPFRGGTVYAATVTLTANSGFTFGRLGSATINGQDAAVSNNIGTAVTLSRTFPATNIQTVTGIAITTQPTNLAYTHGDPLDLAGLAVTLTYDDATTEDVPAAGFAASNITANPAQGDHLSRSAHNGQPVTITFGNLSVSTDSLTVEPKVTTFAVDPIAAEMYNGSAHTPAVTVKDDTTILTLTADYTVAYTNNINAGTATVTITGAGNYAGSTGSASFTINKAAGAAVGVPALSGTTSNSITITAVAAPGNGQAVEYGISREKNGSTVTGWKTDRTFSSLSAGVYYIFARSAESANYSAGPASIGMDEVDFPIYIDTANDWTSARNIISGGGDNKAYSIYVRNTVSLSGSLDNTFGTASGITVTLKGTGRLNGIGAIIVLLTDDQTLIIDSGDLTLAGAVDRAYPLVYLDSPSANLELRNGVISGNGASSTGGGGVYVGSGNFTMSGGTITGNGASGRNTNNGGGVYVSSGSFTMSGGTIINNYAGGSLSSGGRGGGVYVDGGRFTMTGGTICDNRANGGGDWLTSRFSSYGSGVYIGNGGSFTISGGATIRDNTANGGNATSYGGGVYVGSGCNFTMSGGATISGNVATSTSVPSGSVAISESSNGGGIYIANGGSFTMLGGTVSRNTANASYSGEPGSSDSEGDFDAYGGGVHVASGGSFTMSGGEISGNTAYAYAYSTRNNASVSAISGGGGVYVGGSFTMSGEATIRDNTANSYASSTTRDRTNTSDAYGGGVYVRGYRDTAVYVRAIFTMSGGTISDNTANSDAYNSTDVTTGSYGGGVYVGYYGTVTMSNGTINRNTTKSTGISRNSGVAMAWSQGGGVYIGYNGVSNFTMSGGAINGNVVTDATATNANGTAGRTLSGGGGVFADIGGGFTMNGGAISGNRAFHGGGMYINASPPYSTRLRLVTGTVYGSNEGAFSNTATGSTASAALHLGYGSVVPEYGTFSGETWNRNGRLEPTDNTIRVLNGVLQP